MIDKRWAHGEEIFTPTCDMCGDQLDIEYDFMDAVDAKKAAGWHSVKSDGDWLDMCPDCYAKYNHIHTASEDFGGIL